MTTPARALMQQYCSVCKSRYDMTVVSENTDDEVIWLKCPNCQGILPHMPETGDAAEEVAPEAESPEEAPAPDAPDFDVEDAKPYSPQGHFEVGDVLHHRGWNDYGIVLEKEELPGGRGLLKVRFVEQGEMQLVEGAPG